MKRLVFILPVVLLMLFAGCGGGGSIHDCLNAVMEMQEFTQNAPEHQRYEAQGGMDTFCFVEECIDMMHQHINEPLLVTLIDRIEEHCPCLQDLQPSVPLGDYNKLRALCEGYKKRQYRFES